MIDINKIAVVSSKQALEAAFPDEPIKPPTFPDSDGVGNYIIYNNGDVKDVVLDTTQSQANRVEPIFDGSGLIPDSTVRVGEKTIPLTAAGHRVADACVRFSDKAELVHEALRSYENGSAVRLARLAPTALLFGAWDSRVTSGATGVKITRIFHSEIRGHNIVEVPAAGQFVSSVPRIEGQKSGDLSMEGLLDCPFSGLGGVIVKGKIVRNSRVNLRGIRALRGENAAETEKLQNYILGLALYALTYAVTQDLREGCNLVVTKTVTETLSEDGTRSTIELSHAAASNFAHQAAEAFGIGGAVQFIYDEGKALAVATGRTEAKVEKAAAKKSGQKKEETGAVA